MDFPSLEGVLPLKDRGEEEEYHRRPNFQSTPV